MYFYEDCNYFDSSKKPFNSDYIVKSYIFVHLHQTENHYVKLHLPRPRCWLATVVSQLEINVTSLKNRRGGGSVETKIYFSSRFRTPCKTMFSRLLINSRRVNKFELEKRPLLYKIWSQRAGCKVRI